MFSIKENQSISLSLSLYLFTYTIGLDPAEPYFQYTDPAVRLDRNDAKFVDVIHSDVASIMSGGFGMSQSCGHVDFFLNGGVNQPGCKKNVSIKNVVDYISKEKNIFDGILLLFFSIQFFTKFSCPSLSLSLSSS